ncbi:hypothetical protein ACQUQU_03240 [Thalassolituus sp. LLYu03]|uniref:hypothetical protein n=1 Tax=Thalassolituus sp. LLYu03 TaxID=3421656 RepID=UPI003D2824F2
MTRHYLILLRTFWLGGLWGCAYIVRPLLEHRGFFPAHGMEIMNVMVGLGLVSGLLMLLLARWASLLRWRETPLQLLLVMTLLSVMYFALLPWWKLQMMVVHALSVLGIWWLMISPARVVSREWSPGET